MTSGTYRGDNYCNLTLRSNLKISSDSLATIDCEGRLSGFTAVGVANLSIENLVIKNAFATNYGGAALFSQNSEIDIFGVSFENNVVVGSTSNSQGGNSLQKFEQSWNYFKGALWLESSFGVIENCKFINNSGILHQSINLIRLAASGGAIGFFGESNIFVSGCEFLSNSAINVNKDIYGNW